jgi:phosphoglycolate phosphatase-like HAD superfamily hydrolase
MAGPSPCDVVASPRLLLFDIDGTILLTHGVGRTMLSRAFADVLGRQVAVDGVAFSGRTDPEIALEIAQTNGVEGRECAAIVELVLDRYCQSWTDEWKRVEVEALPGVENLLGRLVEESDVHLALVTGNVETVAYRKLSCIGVDAHFPGGAFGSDHHDRNKLPAIAVERMSALNGARYHPSDVIVIGDTPRDILCGQQIGARTIAVCTGYFGRDELLSAGADFVLDTLDTHHGAFELLTNGVAL